MTLKNTIRCLLRFGMIALLAFAFLPRAVGEEVVPLEYVENFDGGIPVNWTLVDGYDDGLTWQVVDPADYYLNIPFTNPCVIIDSNFSGANYMDEKLISEGYDMTRCVLGSPITLEFSNCFAYYGGGLDEVGDVDVSNDGGATWTNVLTMSNDNFGPEVRTLDITPIAYGAPDLKVRFHYYNAREEMWWLVDDMKLSCMAVPEPGPEMVVSCGGFEHPMDVPVTVRRNRSALPLRATLTDGGSIVSSGDLVAHPVVQVLYDSGIPGEEPVDVTQDVLPVGEMTEGNVFYYMSAPQEWHFNLSARPYTSTGTYTITMESGDEEEYTFAPKCEAQFIRQ